MPNCSAIAQNAPTLQILEYARQTLQVAQENLGRAQTILGRLQNKLDTAPEVKEKEALDDLTTIIDRINTTVYNTAAVLTEILDRLGS